jgi:hypothetical protein
MFMPLLNTTILSSQKVNNITFLYNKRKIIVKRMLNKNANGLMPDDNPLSIFHTPDNIEWAFFQTLPDYDKMQKFRRKNNCNCSGKTNDRSSRIRCYCARSHGHKSKDEKCEFMLLAVKTTKRRFHVYSYAEHNHPVQKIKSELNLNNLL